MPGRKKSSKKRKTAVASTVSPIDPKEQLQAEMRSLGYVEGLFIYAIIHANKLPSQAGSTISEFFCFAGLMEIFSPATWRPALSGICGEGKGLKSPHVTESTEVLDSGFHPSGFRIPTLWIHWIPDSKPLDSGFQ